MARVQRGCTGRHDAEGQLPSDVEFFEGDYIDSCNGLITEHSLTAVTADSKRDQIG